LLIGITGIVARSYGFPAPVASRISIVSIAILFIGGAVLLWMVNEKGAEEFAAKPREQ
jgi:hypothetical protein